MFRVKVIIPIYRTGLNKYEQAALDNNLRLLRGLPITFLIPDDLDFSAISTRYPDIEVMRVSSDWMGTRRGIQGYNEMMMSERFYAMFSDYEYIFICHVDAWLFRNDVEEWCRKDYDLVAAPWPTRPRYTRFPLKQYMSLRLLQKPKRKILHFQMFGRIGNGGLSLRKVQTFRDCCIRHSDEISYYNSQDDDMHNEDIFWSFVPSLNIPTVKEALAFSFDLKAKLCYKQNQRHLPMGCHGFYKSSRKAFWSDFIPICKP